MNPKIAYFVHDLFDSAVHRRIRMLAAGAAAVRPLGFRRGAEPAATVEGRPAVDLGQTVDGMLSKRVMSVVDALTKLDKVADSVRDADVVLARNLEMLVIAARARRRYAPTARLVYECLDIHRMLLSKGPDGVLLRLLETRLWRDVDLLLTSSPAFVRNYFVPRGFKAPIKVIENKLSVLEDGDLQSAPAKRPNGPPWRIGSFGMIRCRESLDILSAIARDAAGAVEVIVRGRPSAAVFPNFDKTIAGRPYVRYAGPYRSADLPGIYSDVHFTWAIDYYERGQNSAWLLPNRLYEGSTYGAVPIALTGVETGAWLNKRGAGVVLDEPVRTQLFQFLQSLDQGSYERLSRAIASLPRGSLISDRGDCRELVQALCRPAAERTAGRFCGTDTNVALPPKSDRFVARQ